MTEEIAALHQQIAQLAATFTTRADHLDDRLERIEKALLGDLDLGLAGMVSRVNRLDDVAADATTTHSEIDQRRIEGDRRLHERIDAMEGRWKIAIGIAIGISAASAGGAAWLTSTLVPG